MLLAVPQQRRLEGGLPLAGETANDPQVAIDDRAGDVAVFGQGVHDQTIQGIRVPANGLQPSAAERDFSVMVRHQVAK
ncbi:MULTISPECIES: hypothetical protein [Kitasatospora]|uniref:hypothetical protein n=1 Tax=Kitasatospora TaxID=2063 RepID=UPI0015D5BE65|nr:hypothetical protein [Kitasatospora sp. GP30]